MTHLRVSAFALCLFSTSMVLASCNSTPPPPPAAIDTRAADEAAIRALDVAWSKAAGDKDAVKASSFYADTAVLMAPGAPVATGKDAIQKAYAGLIADKNFALSFAPTKVEVAKSGDLAYEVGDYQLTMSDKKHKPATSKGKYVVVWAKQPDKTWKVIVDAPNTSTD